jgi:predicted permease
VNTLIPLFSNNILPIFITAGAGYFLGKVIEIDPRTISRVTFYVFSPCLVFMLLTKNELEQGAIIQMVGICTCSVILIGIISFVVTKILKFDRKLMVAVMLTTMFTNAGNFGLALVDYAFGKDALAYASIYFVTSGTLIYTIGVLVASMGKASLKQAIIGLFRLPTLYALLLAFLFKRMDWELHISIQRPVELLSQAAIPSMLVLLGLQLQRAVWGTKGIAMAAANFIRLAISPLIAYGLSVPFVLQDHGLQAGVTEASMPSAVMTTVLATEYEVEPEFVTTIVTTTTLLSPLTLTPILAFLGG